MLKLYRRTLTIPACAVVNATARVPLVVIGSSAPSAPGQSGSVIAVGRMRSPSPISART